MNFQKQIAQSLLWRGLYFASLLMLNIFLSRYLQSRNAGWIFYLSNNFAFIVIVAGLTLENSVNYYSSKKSIDDNELAWFSILWSLLVSIVVFIALWIYFGLYKNIGAIARNQYIYYAVCYVTGIQITNFFTVLFYSNKNFFLPNFLMVLLNVIFIFFVPKQDGTANTDTFFVINLYFAFFVITGITLAVAFIIKKQSWRKVSLPGINNMRLLLRYALMALAANVIFFLVYRVDYWFVKRYCSAAELGNYIQVSKIGQMLLIIPGIISSVVFPHTARSGTDPEEIRNNIMRIGRIITALYLLLFITIALVGKWLFPFVFGFTFTLMYIPFLFLLPGIWALSNLYILSAYFAGVNKVKVNVRGAAFALLVILGGDILFIPKYGIYAAAIVSTAGYTINFIYSFVILKKEYTVTIYKYLGINKEDIKWVKSIIHR